VLQADRHRDGEGIHDARESRTLFAEFEEHLAETIVGIGTRGQVALGPAHRKRRRTARSRLGQSLAGRTIDHFLHNLSLGSDRLIIIRLPGFAVAEGLTYLAVVAIDRQRLQAKLPALQVDLSDV